MNEEKTMIETFNQIQELAHNEYLCGYKDSEGKMLEAYEEVKQKLIEQGRNEAWDAARTLLKVSIKESNEILSCDGDQTFEDMTLAESFCNISASRAIKKIREYKERKKQKEDSEIRVGDEAYLLDKNYHSVVTCIYDSLDVKRQAQELIEQVYQRGYKDGENSRIDECAKALDEAVIAGRDEAWEAARKLVGMSYKECNKILSDGDLTIETDDDIFARYTASKVIENLRKFAEVLKKNEEDEIKVGDEVENKYGSKYFVTGINDNMCWGIGKYGCYQDDIKFVKNTNRHSDEIVELLKKFVRMLNDEQ